MCNRWATCYVAVRIFIINLSSLSPQGNTLLHLAQYCFMLAQLFFNKVSSMHCSTGCKILHLAYGYKMCTFFQRVSNEFMFNTLHNQVPILSKWTPAITQYCSVLIEVEHFANVCTCIILFYPASAGEKLSNSLFVLFICPIVPPRGYQSQ